jgi:acyl dehydratase
MFKLNQIILHKRKKKILSNEHKLFNSITKNNHPIHSNNNFAKKSIFKKKVVNGTLVISIIVGLSVEEFSKKCLVNLGYKNIKHLRPVFEGDVLRAKTVIKKIKKYSKKTIISVVTFGINQKKKYVLSLERSVQFS